jgi:hypothetical protein
MLCSVQNSFVLKVMRNAFDNVHIHEKSHHESLGGVKAHENSMFLYKSRQATSAIRGRLTDYLLFFSIAGLIGGLTPLLVLPVVVVALQLPRKLPIALYFTY